MTFEERRLVTPGPEHRSWRNAPPEGAFDASHPRPTRVLAASLGRHAEVSESHALPFHRGWSR